MAIAVALAMPAWAQDLANRPGALPPPPTGAQVPASPDDVSFSAAQLDYDDNADIVTATGDVRMFRNGARLRADKVVWNRQTGEVRATGNVAVTNDNGETAYGDNVVLTDNLHDGVADNMLLVLANGGRLAARHGERKGDVTVLSHAAYTPCRVESDSGCPKRPSWQVTAVRVIVDEGRHRISYRDARFTIFGKTVLALPAFSHPDGSQTGQGSGGFLLPNFQMSKQNGFELNLPYYVQFGPDRDLTVTPHIYSKVLPAMEAQYRALTGNGAYQVRGMATYSARPTTTATGTTEGEDKRLRGFIDANGTWQFGPFWTVSAALRLTTDDTFMRRYNISDDDRLRSTVKAERIDDDSYLSIAGWFVQDLRSNGTVAGQQSVASPGFRQGQQPIALPEIDYRRRFADPWLGGIFTAQVNSLALTRTAGQDTQRAFAGLRWDLRTLTPLGQEVTFTAYGRADVYHTDDSLATTTALYRGTDGWHGRGVAALAADMRWPFVGELFGGTQQIVPRVQIVAEPHVKNLSIPDEDARAVDLEDSNLFALNRFSGYDRWEDASRITYGGEWNYQRPKIDVRAIIGQSYRLSTEPVLLPPGTGLSDRFSDYVGRVSVRYGSFLELTERFRLDKDNLAVRRNEIDATIGSRVTYVEMGYLRLNRNIDPLIEDLRDRSEVRLGARVQLARYWSVFGSTVIDLTSKHDDPLSTADGYQPVRHRLGLLYENECISLGVTWLRDYDQTADARRGSTFSLRLALKNIGR